jgi:hypothetical protein
MKRSVLCLSLLSSLVVCTNGWACGDKLVQIGRGVRYQRANAIRPATIVMFVGPHFDRDAANRLQSQLSVVGHRVMIATDTDTFAAALAKHVDIVLTDVDNLALVSQRVDSMSSKPAIVPMIDPSASTAPPEIRSRFPFIMLLSSRGFDHVALISRVMK